MDCHADEGVQTKQRQVGQVVACEPFIAEMRMDAAKTAQASSAGAQATPVRHFDRVRVAHHHVRDSTAAVDQHPGLATDVRADLGQLAGEFVGDQAIRRDVPAKQALDLANLTGFEAVRVAVDLDERLLGAR